MLGSGTCHSHSLSGLDGSPNGDVATSIGNPCEPTRSDCMNAIKLSTSERDHSGSRSVTDATRRSGLAMRQTHSQTIRTQRHRTFRSGASLRSYSKRVTAAGSHPDSRRGGTPRLNASSSSSFRQPPTLFLVQQPAHSGLSCSTSTRWPQSHEHPDPQTP